VTYLKEGEIHGTRYSSGDIEFPKAASLSRVYKIQVETAHSSTGKIGRAAITPVAVTEDGVATIGLGALLIVAVPFWAADIVVEEYNKTYKKDSKEKLYDDQAVAKRRASFGKDCEYSLGLNEGTPEYQECVRKYEAQFWRAIEELEED